MICRRDNLAFPKAKANHGQQLAAVPILTGACGVCKGRGFFRNRNGVVYTCWQCLKSPNARPPMPFDLFLHAAGSGVGSPDHNSTQGVRDGGAAVHE